ncbi:MAG: tripartite tricarboxylate transporter substrate binding protein [Pigmentiphaga sp.]|uniref:Bug family tripartite tricarboxylate transporter substrate binding protein n=1 Tax=Pigmentiphaga sp. TaxID=1977564 RepID=UPI0029A5D6A6|nr:tripartite tricarboxylate transporter substrate binding protein [Pigmentiphaga sp.]MDX3906494.1 tripartite tricarboxylate transporter substrate binding protein [Pigmentiphaga sp.]
MKFPALRIRQYPLVLIAAALTAATAQAAPADGYPDRPIRMLLPYGPGGIGDLTARVVTQKVGEILGQQIVIENRPSAGGVQSFQGALQAPADGYTIVQGGNGTAISQSLMKELPYDILKDFMQVATLSRFSLLVVVRPDSPHRTLADLVAYAKANPGKLSLGTTNIGSTQHLSAELFKSVAGIEAQVVPYKMSAALLTGVRSGDIDAAFEFVPPLLSSIKGGAVRALAIASDKRNPNLPDVPTAAESGLDGYQVNSWNGVSIRTGTPRPIIDRLNRAFTEAVNSPEVAQKIREMNSEPFALTPEQTRELMIADIAKWKAVIERANIPLN